MAYRHNQLGLLARLDPKQAKLQIEKAFADTNDGKPGRADEKASKVLDIGKSTLKRIIKQLEDKGLKVKRPKAAADAQPVGRRRVKVPKKVALRPRT